MSRALRCRVVYYEYALNEIFIEGLYASIRHCMREYCENKKAANLHDLAFHAISLIRLHRHDVTSGRTNRTGAKPQNQRGKQWLSRKSGVDAVRQKTISSPSARMRITSSTPVLAMGHSTF